MTTTETAPQTTTAQLLVLIGQALATVPADLHAPDGVIVYRGGPTYIRLPYLRRWAEVRQLLTWATAYSAPVHILLSSYGSGSVETSFEIDGLPFKIEATIQTAHAYELGGLLGRPLSQTNSIDVTAAELLAVLPAAAGKA